MTATYPSWSETAAATATIDVAGIYERHAPEIHDFLARTVHDHAMAEDLTQTTFIRLMERGDTVRETEKVRPWLFTVAHNLAVTHVTRRRPSDPIEAAFAIASGEKGPEEEAVAADAARLVWDAARSLEPRQYAVLDLTVRRGFTVAEIAEVLEITPAHAAVVVHRAREALAQAIRLLVVVRQRRHCARLAELVPEGTEVLTPDLRASADRHMRRCEACKEVGEKLTDPAELLSVLPLLPLPVALHPLLKFPHAVPAYAAPPAHAAPVHAAGGAGPAAHLQVIGQRAVELLSQPAVLAVVGAMAIVGAGTGLGLALHGRSHGAEVAATRQLRSGGDGGVTIVPPLTGGPGHLAGSARQATEKQDNSEESAAASTPAQAGDVIVVNPAASPASTPQPSPPPPARATLIDAHPRVPASLPGAGAGADVTVYDPPTSQSPVIGVVLPGQTTPLSASRVRTF